MNQKTNFKIFLQILSFSAICILQTNCNVTDVNGCQTEASNKCFHITKGSAYHEACSEHYLEQCFAKLCQNHSIIYCDQCTELPKCPEDFKQNCMNELTSLYRREKYCKSKSAANCSTYLPSKVNTYMQCWQDYMKNCIAGLTYSRASYGDCAEEVIQEPLCFDIAGFQQCRNVSYTALVCYF